MYFISAEVNADACLADLRAKNNVESTVILKKDRDRYWSPTNTDVHFHII